MKEEGRQLEGRKKKEGEEEEEEGNVEEGKEN